MGSMQVGSIKEYFDTLPERFVATAARGVKATYQFELAGDGGGTYHVKVDDGTMQVAEGPADAPNTTIKMAAGDYVQMVNGKMSGTMAFMKGKLKVTGNVMLAQKMNSFLPPSK
ncbi:MAG TPA: SCP2 sterol-binding domain-containing protein [Polyangiaceae bacterium]|jgi:putative sterol carrier protein